MAADGVAVELAFTAASTPRALLTVAGELTAFVVDTGTPWSTVSPAQARAWGLALEPCENPDFAGAVTADVLHVRPGSSTAYVLAEAFRFLVRDCPNLLGLDFLASARCVLDLHARAPRMLVLE